MKVCRFCRKLNHDNANFCEDCGEKLGGGGATGHTINLVQQRLGSAELDRLVIGGTGSLGQTNDAQKLHGGVEIPVDEVAHDRLNGPSGFTPRHAPEWDQ